MFIANSFKARLVGGPYGRVELPVSAHFESGSLIIDDLDVAGIPAAARDIAISTLIVSVGGFEQPTLFLNWLTPDGAQCSLQPAGESDIATLIASAPAALQPQLAKWRQRGRNSRHIWGWLGGLVGACVLLTLLAWWSYPRISGWLVDQIPVAAEEKLGKLALAQLRMEGEFITSGPAQQAVQRIGDQLTQGSAYHYQWLVKRDKSVNAFAVPGGIVVVHTGLLEKTSDPDELAAVLAHEVQHVERRHSLKQMASSLGLAALLTVTVGDVSGAAAAIAHQLGSNYFSRDKEEEADRLGFQALVRARIEPDGMVAFFQKLKPPADSLAMPEWISSHPATSERIAKIEAMIAQQPCPACRPLDGGADWGATVRDLGPAGK